MYIINYYYNDVITHLGNYSAIYTIYTLNYKILKSSSLLTSI